MIDGYLKKFNNLIQMSKIIIYRELSTFVSRQSGRRARWSFDVEASVSVFTCLWDKGCKGNSKCHKGKHGSKVRVELVGLGLGLGGLGTGKIRHSLCRNLCYVPR